MSTCPARTAAAGCVLALGLAALAAERTANAQLHDQRDEFTDARTLQIYIASESGLEVARSGSSASSGFHALGFLCRWDIAADTAVFAGVSLGSDWMPGQGRSPGTLVEYRFDQEPAQSKTDWSVVGQSVAPGEPVEHDVLFLMSLQSQRLIFRVDGGPTIRFDLAEAKPVIYEFARRCPSALMREADMPAKAEDE